MADYSNAIKLDLKDGDAHFKRAMLYYVVLYYIKGYFQVAWKM